MNLPAYVNFRERLAENQFNHRTARGLCPHAEQSPFKSCLSNRVERHGYMDQAIELMLSVALDGEERGKGREQAGAEEGTIGKKGRGRGEWGEVEGRMVAGEDSPRLSVSGFFCCLAALPQHALAAGRFPGELPECLLLYGHLDHKPEFTGWLPGLGPWETVIRDGQALWTGRRGYGYRLQFVDGTPSGSKRSLSVCRVVSLMSEASERAERPLARTSDALGKHHRRTVLGGLPGRGMLQL